jgi:membrane-bound serine protease (ClpP class)
MAPGSSIGAASPVGMGGEDVGETLEDKVKNILSADIENLAARRGEAATKWAISAVQEAAAATASQALELGVVDFIAADVDDLLQQLDGFEVTVQGEPQVLDTANATQLAQEMGPLQRLLNFIADPAIASILFSLGTLGLIVELRTPGFGGAGIVGAICLLLAFYALGQLDANFAGLALIAVALALFVAEAFTPTFGLLAVGGGVAFILGAILLYDTPGLDVPWVTLIVLTVLLTGFAIFVGSKALAAQHRPPLTGVESLIGRPAQVKERFAAGQPGSVFVAGEWWTAKLESGEVQPGDHVEIVAREGYTLLVRRPSPTS